MKKGNKFTALFLVFTLMALSGSLIAKERRGAMLRITKKDGQQIRGELITIKPNSFLLLDTKGKDVSIDIEDIKFIKFGRKSKILQGMSLGFFIGGASGMLIGAVKGAEADKEQPHILLSWIYIFAPVLWLANEERVGNIVTGLLIGGGIGSITGGILGGVAEKFKTIEIEGKSQEEIETVLAKLRKKARIPDYK